MRTILNKPHKVLWIAMPFLLTLSLFKPDGAIDIQQHDTYYVIALIHVGLLGCIVFALLGFLYWLVRKIKLINWMTAIHVVLTLLFWFVVVIAGLTMFGESDRSYFSLNTINTIGQVVYIFIAGLIVSQLLFLINLVVCLLSRIK